MGCHAIAGLIAQRSAAFEGEPPMRSGRRPLHRGVPLFRRSGQSTALRTMNNEWQSMTNRPRKSGFSVIDDGV